MGKYLFPQLTEKYSAVVSTHGYFEIQKRESYNSYASGIGPVYHADKTNPDGSKIRLPDPVVVYSGSTDELGLIYGPDDDIHFEGDDAEDDGQSVIQERLLEFIAAHVDGDECG